MMRITIVLVVFCLLSSSQFASGLPYWGSEDKTDDSPRVSKNVLWNREGGREDVAADLSGLDNQYAESTIDLGRGNSNNRVLLTTSSSVTSASLSAESLSAKSNFYSEKVVQPILTKVPRLDLSGKAHTGDTVTVAFFTQIAEDSSKITSDCGKTSRDNNNLYCAYIDFAVIMIAIGIVFPVFTFIFTCCFCMGRCCCNCACCCYSCGGKAPTSQYNGCERGSAWLCYLFGIALLIIFSLGGFLSMNQIGTDVDGFFDSLNDVATLPTRFRTTVFDPAIANLEISFASIFDNVNFRLSGVPALGVAIDASKSRVSELDTMFDQLATLAAGAGGNCGTRCDPNNPSGTRGKLRGVQSSLNSVDLSQVNKPMNSSELSKSLDQSVADARSQLVDVSNQLEDQVVSSLKDPRSKWSDSDKYRQMSNFILWGLVWLMVLLSLLAMIIRKSGMFWCVYCCSFWLVMLYFIIFLVLFLPSLVFGDTCIILPTQENGKGSGNIKTITKSLSNADRTVRIFDQCLLSSNGNFFDAFDLPRSTITGPLKSFNVSTLIPDSAVSSNLNASIYMVPMLSVQSDLAVLTAADVGAGSSSAVTNHIVAMRAKSDQAVSSMQTIDTANKQISANISLMKVESQQTLDKLADDVINAASCSILKDGYESVLHSICNTTNDLNGIWFSSFVLGFICISFLICNMKAAKRIPPIKIVPRKEHYKGNGGKKNRVVPTGSAEAAAAATEKKHKKSSSKTKKTPAK